MTTTRANTLKGLAMTFEKFNEITENKLTNYVKKSHLTFHWIGVDLAHVPSLVRCFHLFDVQEPRFMLAMGYSYSMVFRNDVILYGQDRLRVHPQPGHLKTHYLVHLHFYQLNSLGKQSWHVGIIKSYKKTLVHVILRNIFKLLTGGYKLY